MATQTTKRSEITREINVQEFDDNVEAIRENQSRSLQNQKDVASIRSAASIYTFASEAEVTAKWNELNTEGTPPKDGTSYIRTDLKKYGVWDSSVTAKGVTTDLDVPENLEVKIQEAYVLTQGKTDLTDFEVGDKFRAWLGDRYVVGKIIALLTDTFQNSINDTTKIKLVTDSEI
jgi:hypothetical protein